MSHSYSRSKSRMILRSIGMLNSDGFRVYYIIGDVHEMPQRLEVVIKGLRKEMQITTSSEYLTITADLTYMLFINIISCRFARPFHLLVFCVLVRLQYKLRTTDPWMSSCFCRSR